MTVCVRPVNFDFDRSALLAILQANLPLLPHGRRFDWLYRNNPDGPAWSWFACERTGNRIVGVASVFPRLLWVDGQVRMCGQVGDFAIAATHRSLGPAVLLQRATFEPVDQKRVAFCYDCPPHDAGMATFRRLGVAPACSVSRYALPLRTAGHWKKWLGFAPPLITPLGDLILQAARIPWRRVEDLDIDDLPGHFDDEFSALDAATAPAEAIRACRSAAHLNWRYRDDPLNRYHVLTARRKGELVAYLVLTVSDQQITIVDLFGRDLPAAAPALLRALVQRHGKSGQTVEAVLSEDSELEAPILKSCFRRRSVAARVVAYAAPGSATAAFLGGRPRWAFVGAEIRA